MARWLAFCIVWTFLFVQPQDVSAQPGSKLVETWVKLRKARINRNGENPQRERPPLTKPLNDPVFLEEGAPEILKKAAEVKQAEDLKVQKIKAVKYLTTIGCGCYDLDDSITEALIEAAGDCTEEVRMATMEALLGAACGQGCAKCGTKGCCKEAMLMKLYKMAYERDDKGCYLEPSAPVRAAAKKALKACCPGVGPVEITEPEVLPAPKVKKPEKVDDEAPADDDDEVPADDSDEDVPDEEPSIEDDADVDDDDAGDADDLGDEDDSVDSLPSLDDDDDEQEVFRRSPLGRPYSQLRPSDLEYGVIVNTDSELRIAHVHFQDQGLQFPRGAKLMAVVEREGKQFWMGPLTVFKSFDGSAHVTGPEQMDWTEIHKGTPVISTTTQAKRIRAKNQKTRYSNRSKTRESRQPTSVADKSYSAFVLPAQRIKR